MDDIEVWLRTDLVRLDFYILCVGCGKAEALLRTGLGGCLQSTPVLGGRYDGNQLRA